MLTYVLWLMTLAFWIDASEEEEEQRLLDSVLRHRPYVLHHQ